MPPSPPPLPGRTPPRARAARARSALAAAALGVSALAQTGCDWLLGIDKSYQNDPVNQLPTNIVDKSFFVGNDYENASDDPVFWWQSTVLDPGAPAGTGGLSTNGYATPLTRIKWQLTEDLLIGAVATGPVDGAGKPTTTCLGPEIIVVAYPVLAHLDIAYDPEKNLTYGTEDRQWFKRQYIRVDWATNLATDCATLDLAARMGFAPAAQYELLSYYESNPASPDAPHIDVEGGYLDVTNRLYAKPQNTSAPLPVCDLRVTPARDANSCSVDPAEMTVRHSFRRVEGDLSSEEWDSARSRAFGVSTGWSLGLESAPAEPRRLAHRYALWEQTHASQDAKEPTGQVPCSTALTTGTADPHRDIDDDGTDDECAAVGPGATCDVVQQACTLPLAQRAQKPLVWTFTDALADLHYDDAREAVHQWDVALRAAVLSGRHAECVRTGGADCEARFPALTGRADDGDDAIALAREVDDCREGRAHEGEDCDALADTLAKARGVTAGVLALAKMPEAAVLCHNPVESADPPACGEDRLPAGTTARACAEAQSGGESTLKSRCAERTTVRRGDLRYNRITVLRAQNEEVPWSQIAPADDPTTGQRISSEITVWAPNIDAWSRKITARARFVRGEIPLASVTDAPAANAWIDAATAGTRGTLGTLTEHELIRRASAITGVDAWGKGGIDEKALDDIDATPALRDRLAAEAARVARVQAAAGTAASMDALVSSRMASLEDTDGEVALLSDDIEAVAGTAGWPATESVQDLVSPLRALDRRRWRTVEHVRDVRLTADGSCYLLEPPPPAALPVFAEHLLSKFAPFDPKATQEEQSARAERIAGYLTHRMIQASILHQMGHALGLAHDLAASADAANYPPQYWQLRTKDGAVTAACADRSATGEDCVGPRYFDPPTTEEQHELIGMFGQGSVMDVAGDPTSMLLGLGAHDFAATALLYGEAVTVHARPGEGVGSAHGRGEIEALDNPAGVLGLRTTLGSPDGKTAREIPYSEIQSRYQVIDPASCKPVDPLALRPAAWDDARLGTFHPLLDAHVVTVSGKPTRCRQSPVDHVTWRSLRAPQAKAGEAAADYDGGPAIDRNGRVRVAYRTATDLLAGAGNVGASREDAGADAFEIADHHLTQSALGPVFEDHGRGRADRGPLGQAELHFSRSMEELRDGMKGVALLRRRLDDVAAEPSIAADPAVLWAYSSRRLVGPQVLAAAAAVDQITARIGTPQAGEHLQPAGDPVLRSRALLEKPSNLPTSIVVPNGAVAAGGLAAPAGEEVSVYVADASGYDRMVSAGASFDKAFGPLLLTESDDRLDSDTVDDTLKGYRTALSPADLFPDAYRRFLANALTSDDARKGVRVAAGADGAPIVDAKGFPTGALGFTSYWAPRPEVCFAAGGGRACTEYGAPDSLPADPALPAHVALLDPQLGRDPQRSLIVWAYVFLPKEGQSDWLDLLEVDTLEPDGTPDYPARIELHVPGRDTYVARTFGTEVLFGQTVQRGIGARVLEQANQLASEAYQGQWQTGPDGVTQWFLADIEPGTDKPIVVSKEKAAAFEEHTLIPWLLSRMTTWATKNKSTLYP